MIHGHKGRGGRGGRPETGDKGRGGRGGRGRGRGDRDAPVEEERQPVKAAKGGPETLSGQVNND